MRRILPTSPILRRYFPAIPITIILLLLALIIDGVDVKIAIFIEIVVIWALLSALNKSAPIEESSTKKDVD